jgi:hypothetical protein
MRRAWLFFAVAILLVWKAGVVWTQEPRPLTREGRT